MIQVSFTYDSDQGPSPYHVAGGPGPEQHSVSRRQGSLDHLWSRPLGASVHGGPDAEPDEEGYLEVDDLCPVDLVTGGSR